MRFAAQRGLVIVYVLYVQGYVENFEGELRVE